ncbi:hypothetical protein DXA13_16525 [Clostridium sp. AM58-1XD]|nr:hypothetical protein DXA13_16525 [Clostridium sp. AM58-1XD]
MHGLIMHALKVLLCPMHVRTTSRICPGSFIRLYVVFLSLYMIVQLFLRRPAPILTRVPDPASEKAVNLLYFMVRK